MTEHSNSVEALAGRLVELTGGNIVLSMPLGLGKPNALANALYRLAVKDQSIALTIITALSLTRPRASGGLEKRFLDPFVDRVYGDYEELDYLLDSRAGKLPDNVRLLEFFVQPAAELNNAYAQQNYISSNYTHIARDVLRYDINVLAQTVAAQNTEHGRRISLSCNPEVTLDLAPAVQALKTQGKKIFTVGQIHPELPFMPNSAEVSEDLFDFLVDDPGACRTLISTPNMPVSVTEHFIGLTASTLVRDGGTLQVGIGALGDAVAAALLLRHQNNKSYCGLLEDALLSTGRFPAIEESGPLDTFQDGLYGCSEMFTYGLFQLLQAGVVKREVQGPRGEPIKMTGGFFLGPRAFYEGLRNMPQSELCKIDMTNISFVNALYGQEELKRTQRVHGRFINTAFTVTLLGAAAADQLEDGRILSGVGGQYNFVAQAHELEGARSILLVRSTRSSGGKISSNIVWNYAHTTIPRHLRDIVVTEYGIADLRGKTDSDVIDALLAVADSRFQGDLMDQAKAAGKLPGEYQIPESFTKNTPDRLQQIYRRHHHQGLFPEFPLGSDFTRVEQALLRAMQWLRSHVSPRAMLDMARTGPVDDATHTRYSEHLARMGLKETDGIKEMLYQQLLLKALAAIENPQ